MRELWDGCETECYEIDPAQMDGKEGYWHVFLLDIEDMSIAYSSGNGEISPIVGTVPACARQPDLGIEIVGKTFQNGRYNVIVRVDFADHYGDYLGTPATDGIEFLANGVVVGQKHGLSGHTGADFLSTWQKKQSRQTFTYEYSLLPKQGMTTLSVRTIAGPGMERAMASTGIKLDKNAEGSQIPGQHKPSVACPEQFSPSVHDSIGIVFPGGSPTSLQETGPATLSFSGTPEVAGVATPVTLTVANENPGADHHLNAQIAIGAQPEIYQIYASVGPGAPSYGVATVRRVLTSRSGELPTIHLSALPDPTVIDSLGVCFPGGQLVSFQETAADTLVFSGVAEVEGAQRQATVVLGGVEGQGSGSPALLCAQAHLSGGNSHYVESVETGAGTGVFGPVAARPIVSESTTAITDSSAEADIIHETGASAFMLRFKVPGYLADMIEDGDVEVWVGGMPMSTQKNIYLLPSEQGYLEGGDALVCVTQGAAPRIFTWSRDGADIVSTPAGAFGGDQFEVEFKRDGTVIWERGYSLGSQAPRPPAVLPPQPTYEEQVEGCFLFNFNHYGQAMLNAFKGLGGTIVYDRLVGNPFDCSLWWTSQMFWDAGIRPVIYIDSQQNDAFDAASLLYERLCELFEPGETTAWQIEKARPPYFPPESLGLDEKEASEWVAQWQRITFAGLAERMEELRMLMETGVSVVSTHAGIVLTLASGYDLCEDGKYGQAAFTCTIEALPIIGKMASRMGKRIILRMGSRVAIEIEGDVFRGVAELLERVKVSGKERVLVMRELKKLLEDHKISREYLEYLYDTGQLTCKGDQYKILQEGIERRTGEVYDSRLHRNHHECPLQQERDFLIRGIDPNDGFLCGIRPSPKYHQNVLHGGSTTKLGDGAFGFKGGAWNYQWKRFFETKPWAEADEIMEFRSYLWSRILERYPDISTVIEDSNAWQNVRWPYPAGGF